MPNILGDYSLTEVTKLLNVSTTWVKRVVQLFSLKGSSGQRGKKSLYSSETVGVLTNVLYLRELGISFEEIKQLWEIENELSKLAEDTCEEKGIKENKSFEYTPMTLHIKGDGRLVLMFKFAKLNGPQKIALTVMMKKYEGIMERINERIEARERFSGLRSRFAEKLKQFHPWTIKQEK